MGCGGALHRTVSVIVRGSGKGREREEESKRKRVAIRFRQIFASREVDQLHVSKVLVCDVIIRVDEDA